VAYSKQSEAIALLAEYQGNVFRYLSVIARDTESRLMNALSEKGYQGLLMSYTVPLSLLASSHAEGIRVTHLADKQGISKQLCVQMLRPIEKYGFIERVSDPDDGRAKRVRLTSHGKALIGDAVEELKNVAAFYAGIIGQDKIKKLSSLIYLLRNPGSQERLGIHPDDDSIFPALVGVVSRDFEKKLINLIKAQGHRDMMPSYTQVLSSISARGTSPNKVAEQNHVTVQAINRIANELEALNYIKRIKDPIENKGKVLVFTDRGLQLIQSANNAAAIVDEELKQDLSVESYQELESLLKSLYSGLGDVLPEVGEEEVCIIELTEQTDDESSDKDASLTVYDLLLWVSVLIEKENGGKAQEKLTRRISQKGDKETNLYTFSTELEKRLQSAIGDIELVSSQVEAIVGKEGFESLQSIVKQISESLNK